MDYLNNFKKYLLQDKNKHSKITVKNYLADVKKFISWFEETFHTEFLPTLISKEIAELYKKHISKPNDRNYLPAARSMKRYLSSLRKFYSFLISNHQVIQNPFEIVQPVKSLLPDPFYLKEFKNYLLLSHTSKATRKNYLMDITQFVDWLKHLPEQTTLNELTLPLVEEYKDRLLYQARFAPVSVNRKLSSLRKYFSWAKNQNYFHQDIEVGQVLNNSLSNDIKSEQILPALPHTFPAQQVLQTTQVRQYSSFPPLRLAQKLSQLSNATFDLLFLLPVVKMLAGIKYEWWKFTGKKVFTTALDGLITQEEVVTQGIKSLPKAFYAPLKVSTEAMPLPNKIYHHLRHTRPSWYKKYHSHAFVHYIHFGVLLIYALTLGFTIYHALIGSERFQSAALASLDSPPRVLSFKGRLTDATNTPITEESQLRFSLYNDKIASGTALLWQESQTVQPDHDGNFETTLGEHQSLSQKFLNDNPNLFLGIAIGNNPELSPRQQIATILYAKEAERVQGMLPSSDPKAGTANILLALDSSGNLTIGGKASPKFEATGGEFILSGQTLTLKTGEGSNTNVQISPDGTGIIDAQKPIQNTTNYNIGPGTEGMVLVADSMGILADSSSQSALLINQNSSGDLISANSNGTAKFSLDYLGSAIFAQDLSVNGNNLTTASTTFNLVNKNVKNLNIGGEATSISIGSLTGFTLINNGLMVASTSAFQSTVTAQGLITANGGLTLPEGKPLSLLGFTSGAVPFVDSNKQLSQDPNFFWAQDMKRLGLGTNTPLYRLDVRDSQTAGSVAQIYNTETGIDADGLTIKLGNSSATVANTNHFINFETVGAGVVGSIKGNGLNGIQIALSSPGDWAEYINKYQSETISFGSLVCMKEDGNATSCDETNNKLLGVASENPTIIAGENKGDSSIAVGLTGLVQTFVSTQNGTIKPGDLITYSANPGIGVKATGKAMVVGRALEGYENTNGNEVGKILIALQVNYYDPGVELTEAGNLPIEQPINEDLSSNQIQIAGIIDHIKTGIIQAQKISTQSLEVASENITLGGYTLRDYITQIVDDRFKQIETRFLTHEIISPLASINHIKTNLISPLASDEIALQFDKSQISVTNPQASGAALATIDNQGNASFSGTLRARRIIADEIALSDEALAKLERTGTSSANTIPNSITNITNVYNTASSTSSAESLTPNLVADFAKFNQGIIALGASSLTDVSINGVLHLGESLVVSENTINTIGTTLELQSLRQGNLSLMGGLVGIDTQGNLNVEGNAHFAKDVTVDGILAANIISPVPNSDLIIKLTTNNQGPKTNFMIHDSKSTPVLSINQLGDLIASGSGTFKDIATNALSIVRGAQADTSLTETIATSSAGTAVISANKTERTIKTPFVKENSLIYITATSDTSGQSLYIARQIAETKTTKGSFTIQIPQVVNKNIKFNWWIVN